MFFYKNGWLKLKVLKRHRQPAMHQLPETGFLRLRQIIGSPETKAKPATPPLIPVSKSTWWGGIKTGRFPQPVKLGPRVTAWRVEDIRACIDSLGV